MMSKIASKPVITTKPWCHLRTSINSFSQIDLFKPHLTRLCIDNCKSPFNTRTTKVIIFQLIN